MKALLLAAGLGTRLRPFTFYRAKASLPLLNVPFIRYPLQCLVTNGIREIVINLHAHAESVEAAAGMQYAGVPIHYSREPQILGTAGAIANARPFLDGELFVVMNGDMLCNFSLQPMLQQHRETGSTVTLMVMRHEKFPQYSGLSFDSSRIPLLLPSGESGEKYHYTGVQIISDEIFNYIPAGKKSEIFTDIYPQLAVERKITGFLYEDFWLEVGTLHDYLRTSVHLAEHPLPENLQPEGMERSNISSRAQIETGAAVSNSIVMEGAKIRSEARVEDSIIGWDITVSNHVHHVALAKGILPWFIRE